MVFPQSLSKSVDRNCVLWLSIYSYMVTEALQFQERVGLRATRKRQKQFTKVDISDEYYRL